ncbi:hypothetical protein BDZ89DRAFT_706235 [Hymenopellis radicata]|nr:hypothetical protein BDZ89DRAFT_706235 [Hymenopellis radicata]
MPHPFIPPLPASLRAEMSQDANVQYMSRKPLAPSALRPRPRKGILKQTATSAETTIPPNSRQNMASSSSQGAQLAPHRAGPTREAQFSSEHLRAQAHANWNAYVHQRHMHAAQAHAYQQNVSRPQSYPTHGVQASYPAIPHAQTMQQTQFTAHNMPPEHFQQPQSQGRGERRPTGIGTANEGVTVIGPVKMESISLARPLKRHFLKDPYGQPTNALEYKVNIAFDPSEENDHSLRWNAHWRRYVRLQQSELDVCASTHTTLEEMTVYCPTYTSDPPYRVKLTCVAGNSGIHCVEVLEGVFRTYRPVLSMRQLEKHRNVIDSDAFKKAYEWRISHSKDPAREAQAGPRRVDLLLGRVLFGGMKQTADGQWSLLDLAPEPSVYYR